MNRFLTRRKDKGLDDNASGGKKNKKGKKGQSEPEPELDFKMSLPSTDDFRTSLIMPSLSTRFSMLREQDDPNSKLGKASDDSVLHPKRQSRLHEFGFMPGGLSDIAEVSSLNGSVRPPFAAERTDSFESHSTEEAGGSIMSRARAGEGNVLFGGRQKIYKVSNTGLSKGLGGKILYDDDVHMSAFQRLRQQEKDRLREQEMEAQEAQDEEEAQATEGGQQSEPSSPAKDTYSPSLSGYSQRRETSSSTNSGPANARSSTAATSIASQGAISIPEPSPALPSATPTSPTEMNRSGTKARRLYDQALDQHMFDQQSSAMNRLNSIQKTRAAPTGRSTPPLPFSQARSATNLNDRFNRNPPLRTASPSAVMSGKDAQSNSSSPILSRPQSPPLASPLASDCEDAQTLNSALQPNDRGKATAMGAFNKPKQAFSEQQYAERLKQMQQERDTPSPKPETPRKNSIKEESPRKPSLKERAEMELRKRTEAGSMEKARSGSSEEKRETPSPFSVFQMAASQMKGSAANLPPSPPKQTPLPPLPPLPLDRPSSSTDSQSGQTFFASPGSSDDEGVAPKPRKPSDGERRPHNIPTATGPAPPILDHPALRSRSNSRGDQSQHLAFRSRSNSRPAPTARNEILSTPSASLHSDSASKGEDPDIDSPTLGPNNGGLSGLIRQHLRNISTVSSDYDDSNADLSPPALEPTAPLALQTQNVGLQARQLHSETNTATHSGHSHSNPWDLDDLDNPYYGEGTSTSSTSPVDAHKPKPQASSTSAAINTAQALNDTIAEWENEIKKTHRREPSVEERDAFQRELALRQRAIQESLRNRAGSRNASPAPAGRGVKTALSMLRAKSSKESFSTIGQKQPDGSTKAARMLGLGANAANASNTSLAGPYSSDHWRSQDRFGQQEPPLRQKPSRILQQSEQDALREQENRQRSATNDSNRAPRSNGRTPPASRSSSTRDRSSSEVSGGRSRSGPYRDDLEQAMAEGTGSRTSAYPPNASPSLSGYPTQPLPSERPSLDSQGRMRSRSNSRTAASNYFESKHLQPIQTSNMPSNAASPRLTPSASPMPQFSPGLPVSPRPSPGVPSPSLNAFRPQPSPVPSSFSANNTPPVSGTSTPITPGFNSGAGAGAIIPPNHSLRKKSIAKSDISEPIFLSTTSAIDTINLPPGASLKNGNGVAPPLPPINPRRRFGFGRSAMDDPAIQKPNPPYAEPTRTNSSEALASKAPHQRQRLRKTSSEGKSLHGQAQVQGGPSPAMPSMPFGSRNGSPPRPVNNNAPVKQQNMDGAMF